jgi:hypothetical protein
MVGDETIVVQNFARLFVRDNQLEPVDQERVIPLASRDLVSKAIVPQFAAFALPMALGKGRKRTIVQKTQPLIQSLIRPGFADKNEELMVAFGQEWANGLVGIQIIAQIGQGMRGTVSLMPFQPAFGGISLTSLLLLPVWWHDKFGR